MKKISLENVYERVYVGSIIVVATGISMLQTIVYWMQTPKGTTYLFAHNYIEDYYYYLQLMRQGYDGAWLATSRLTPETFPPQLVNLWFLFLGHLAKISHISIPLIYTLARAGGALALLLFSYGLICRIYREKTKRLMALVIVATSTFWWMPLSKGIEVPALVRTWTELDPLFRLSYIPHHLWSKVFFLGLLMLLGAPHKKIRISSLLGIIMVTAAMGFASPIIIAIFIPMCIFWITMEAIQNRSLTNVSLHILIPTGIAAAVAILVAYHHRIIQYSVFPWTGSYIAWENFMRYPITLGSFLQSLGPTFFLFLFTIPFLYRKNPTSRLLLSWAAVGFLLIFVAGPFIPLSNSRYLSGYYFIPLGIGAVEGMWILATYVSRWSKIKEQIVRNVFFFILFGYFLLGLGATWRLHAQYIAENSTNPQVYVPNDLVAGLKFLETHDPASAVVLARPWISTMIPALTSHRVIAGHALMSIDNETRKSQIDAWYTYQLTPEAARTWLSQYHVRYMVEDHRSDISDTFYKTLSVELLYQKGSVMIYEYSLQ